MSSCAGVEMRVVRVHKSAWLANQYLEHGKEPPAQLTIETKAVPPTIWLALIDAAFKFLPKVLKHREQMYFERTITIFWRNPYVDPKADKR